MLGVSLSLPTIAAARSAFSPFALFSSGEQGVWFDPSDLSTLFQDSAGTIPVTAVEQPVGKILDKSGRGNHATQATSASRPILRQEATGEYYLAFDGTDDSLATAAINFSGTNKVNLFAGVRKLSDASFPMIAELSATINSNNGAFNLLVSSAGYTFSSKGTAMAQAALNVGYASPISTVITGIGDISGDLSTLRFNGTQVSQLTTDQGTGNYGNYPLYIGRRGGSSLPFNGRLYSLIVRGALSSAAQIASTEAWVNAKTRAY